MERIRLSTPKQILDAVPKLLGYSPVGSLVAIPLSGRRGGVVLRFDLPSLSNSRAVNAAPYASAVIGHLAYLSNIERVVFVLSPNLPFGSGPMPPHSELAEALVEFGDRAGIEVVLCLCRALDAWGVYGCDDPDCCDVGPRALGAQDAWREAAEPVIHAEIASAPAGRRRAFAEADERHAQVHEGEDDFSGMRQGWLAALTPEGGGSGLSDAQLAGLLCMLRGRRTSELLLITVAFGDRDELLSLSPIWASLLPGESTGPQLPAFSRERVRTAVACLRDLGALVDLDEEPGLLAGIAWLEWASGRASAGAAFAQRALARRPDDRVAASVVWLVERCVLPPWLSDVQDWLTDADTDTDTDADTDADTETETESGSAVWREG
ncbi:hypothetical protein C5E10_05730 [Pseudoclavibacter sp. RFBG4]|uniref:DUF4192 family protein n=1 Tax=Pseudoclavibacter sp. RFBG4 TaxID=2080575 RepID=UPI000CE81AB1|nr:DUF4192 family protein [Pseudoclavibacter sp. RFBG4]PPG35098.1 hypothetical protein C5E10_05730 [Pseudoclavibacter sp. RFBG4]